MDISILAAHLREHEGFRSHVYQDTQGFWTIGYGRLVDQRRGGGISRDEAEYLLRNDIARVVGDLDLRASWWKTMPERVQYAICNMVFQMGIEGFLEFKDTIALLKERMWVDAADNAMRSKWARQTPVRAKMVTDWIRNCDDGRH